MVACSDSDNATGLEPLSEPQAREALASLRAEIETIVGLSGPLSTCRSIALGAKPCGGPRQYLVYSTAQTDEVLLVEKVAEYNARDADTNARYGGVSDCMLVVKPPLGLRDGQCAVQEE